MVNGLDVVSFIPRLLMFVWSYYAISLFSLRYTLQ